MEQIRVEKTASRGIVVEKVYMYLEPDLTPATGTIADDQVQAEIEKFEAAKNAVVEELGQLAEKNEIFAAHLEIANDFMLQDGVESKIKDSKSNVEQAISNTIDEFAMIFASMDDEYMKERAADVRDIGKRMMAVVKGVKLPDLGVLTESLWRKICIRLIQLRSIRRWLKVSSQKKAVLQATYLSLPRVLESRHW